MNRDGKIELAWADGDYAFRLGWGELEQLQEKCDAGPYVILQRLVTNTWNVGDISHTIRLGLIGGGLKPVEALTLVRDYVEKRPPLESLIFAKTILVVALMGAPEESVGEPDAASPEGETLTISPTES